MSGKRLTKSQVLAEPLLVERRSTVDRGRAAAADNAAHRDDDGAAARDAVNKASHIGWPVVKPERGMRSDAVAILG